MLELAREIQELIEAEAAEALASGWAELRVEEGEIGLSLHLEPAKLASAPLEIYFDSAELVVCSPGRKGMSCEFFSQDPDEIKRQVRALAAAVVAGTYSERTRPGTIELLAEWPGPEGSETAKRDALATFGATGGGEWTAITYEPY
jgi:hypothetical protein